MHARPVGAQGVVQGGDRGQRLVVHAHGLDRIRGRRRALGHDEGDRLAHVRDDLLRQDLGAGGRYQARVGDEQRQASERSHVGRRQDVNDAGASPRRAGANGQQTRVGVGAAVDGDVEQPRQRHVGHVAAAARDESPVLPPPHARPEQPLGHQPSRRRRAAAAGPMIDCRRP